jgi:hypothetical protein
VAFIIFVGSYIAQNVFGNPHIRGLTQIITIACGVLVVLGLRFGVRVTVLLYAFEAAAPLASRPRSRGATCRSRSSAPANPPPAAYLVLRSALTPRPG